MDATTAEMLRGVPLFAELDDASLERAASLASVSDHPPGTVLIEPGMPGAGLYVVVDGTVIVELHDRTVELGRGEFVGELSLLTDRTTRSARVRAQTPVRALAIARPQFLQLLHEQPSIALTMLSTLAERLQELIEPA